MRGRKAELPFVAVLLSAANRAFYNNSRLCHPFYSFALRKMPPFKYWTFQSDLKTSHPRFTIQEQLQGVGFEPTKGKARLIYSQVHLAALAPLRKSPLHILANACEVIVK
jgi:hypothetical protein